MNEPLLQSIIGCARCRGAGHDNLEFRPFTYPVELPDGRRFTHWATCPANGEPILLRLEAIPEP